jgi:hypothetical protein
MLTQHHSMRSRIDQPAHRARPARAAWAQATLEGRRVAVGGSGGCVVGRRGDFGACFAFAPDERHPPQDHVRGLVGERCDARATSLRFGRRLRLHPDKQRDRARRRNDARQLQTRLRHQPRKFFGRSLSSAFEQAQHHDIE